MNAIIQVPCDGIAFGIENSPLRCGRGLLHYSKKYAQLDDI